MPRACKISVLQPGTEPAPPAGQSASLTTELPGKSHVLRLDGVAQCMLVSLSNRGLGTVHLTVKDFHLNLKNGNPVTEP